MKILVPPLYNRVRQGEPFTGDAYGRRTLALNLTRLLRATDDGLVVTVEGEWGSGKTTFLRMWESLLISEPDLVPVYYNSFSHDFTHDPFVSLAATIYDSLQSRAGQRKDKAASRAQLSHLKKASKRLAVDLAQMTAGLAVSSLTSGLVRADAVKTWLKRVFNALTFDTLKVNADAKFEAFIRSEDSIRKFQQSLRNLLTDGGSTRSKVVILIDELDRCRPIFAVELLEKIKHFFNTPGVMFVLGVNPDQLVSTIRTVYGISESASKVYLEKFVDLSTRLPLPAREHIERDEKQLLLLLATLSDLLGFDSNSTSLRDELPLLAQLIGPGYYNLTPRAIEKLMSYVSLGLNSCSLEDAQRLKKAVLVAAAVRIADPEVYQKLRESGSFYDRTTTAKINIFSWAEKVFQSELKKTSGNVFVVESVLESARLLDMYEIPASQEGDAEIAQDHSLQRTAGTASEV